MGEGGRGLLNHLQENHNILYFLDQTNKNINIFFYLNVICAENIAKYIKIQHGKKKKINGAEKHLLLILH